jgi:hypothetical protein
MHPPLIFIGNNATQQVNLFLDSIEKNAIGSGTYQYVHTYLDTSPYLYGLLKNVFIPLSVPTASMNICQGYLYL